MLSPPQPGQLSWTETVIHTFAGGSKDGALPQGELLFDNSTRALFGAAYGGGASGLGVVFALTHRHHRSRFLVSRPGTRLSVTPSRAGVTARIRTAA
jgi:hypothetical protein